MYTSHADHLSTTYWSDTWATGWLLHQMLFWTRVGWTNRYRLEVVGVPGGLRGQVWPGSVPSLVGLRGSRMAHYPYACWGNCRPSLALQIEAEMDHRTRRMVHFSFHDDGSGLGPKAHA